MDSSKALNYLQLLEHEFTLFTLRLYKNPVIPRNVVQNVVEVVTNFVYLTFSYLQKSIEVESKDSDYQLIFNVFNSSKTVFDKFNSERKRFELYKEKGLMIEPVTFLFGKTCSEKKNKNGKQVIKKQKLSYYIPLKWSLKVLLEIPGTYRLLKNYIKTVQNEKQIIFSFVQSELYKKKCLCLDKEDDIFPLFIFIDDFEAGNGMGSHAGKNKL